MNTAMLAALRDQAADIYYVWINGGKATAPAMLNQVPPSRLAYVVMTMTVLAAHDGNQHILSKLIERVTK
jgi:hypothetical protein